jgi:signal peptidase I
MKRAVFLLWHSIQGVLLSVLVVGGTLFLAGRLGFMPPFSAYVILSGSMAPALPVGSVVITQKQDRYAAGDIITFLRPGEKTAVSHRIVQINDKHEIITKGDANKTPDNGTVGQANVTGKVFFAIPYLGYIVEFAKSPKGFLALIVIPATIIIYEELKKVRSELGKDFGRLVARFRKKKVTVPETRGYSRVPYIATGLVVLATALLFTATAGAYFFDKEQSIANLLGAATSFGEKTANLFNSDPYTCPTGAGSTGEPHFGFVVLKLVSSMVKADIKLAGATPNASYDIWINEDPGGCPLAVPTAIAAITTDGSGNGLAHVETAFIPGATNFWVSAVGGGQVLRSTAVTLP